MQTDGAGWYAQDIYIQGVTNWEETGPPKKCRSFATYATWQKCMDHVLTIMAIRIQGTPMEIVPTDPNDSTFFGNNYALHWVGNSTPATIALSKNCYQQAMTQMPT